MEFHVIIDAHTHIYPESVAEKALATVIANTGGRLKAYTAGTAGSLMDSMNAAGVDISIVLTVATSPGHGNGILQWMKDAVTSFPRMIFFGSVHPHDDDYRDQIRQMTELGLQGLKFHPGYQNFPVNSKAAYAVYEEATKQNLLMYFHSGFDPSLPECDYASLERFADFLNDFRGAKIVLAHGGGYDEWDRVMDLLGDKQCYFDIAFVLEKMKQCKDGRELYRQNEDYFIFGSDSPWRDQKTYVEMIRNSDMLIEEQKEKLLFRNIQKLIKI